MKNKILLLIGKCLIAVGLMWPVPCGFILKWLLDAVPSNSIIWQDPMMNDILMYLYNIPMWGVKHGYWWPILGIVIIGILLCAIASMKNADEQILQCNYKHTPIALLFTIIKWCLIGIVGFYLIATLLIGFVYLINHIEVTGPFIIGTIVLVPLILFGIAYLHKNKNN